MSGHAATGCTEQEGGLLPCGAHHRAWAEWQRLVKQSKGAYSPPGKSILEVHLFASPNLLKKQGSAIIWLMDWCPSTSFLWLHKLLPIFSLIWINSNIIVTSYKFRKNSSPEEKREVLMVPWGGGHVKYDNARTIWAWGCKAATSSDHLPNQDQLLSFTQCSRNANLPAASLKAWPPSLFSHCVGRRFASTSPCAISSFIWISVPYNRLL